MRFRLPVAFSLFAASALALTACAPAAPANISATDSCAGVRVSVEFDLLGKADGSSDIQQCAPLTSGTETVADALAALKISTEGTAKYGDKVVCRVNGLPGADTEFTVPGYDPYVETCSNMSPEFAYWALWIRKGDAAWDYATEGISSQMVAPGDSIGLIFSTGGAAPTPGA